MWRTGLALTALGFTAFPGVPAAAAELPESIARCADIADNLERLTCYDRQNPPRRGGTATTPANPTAEFGATEELVRKRGETTPSRGPDRITAKVTRIFLSAAGDTLIELDNGQVWQQVQHRIEPLAASGDEVTLTRGALGSFFLVSKSRLSTRVKRVK